VNFIALCFVTYWNTSYHIKSVSISIYSFFVIFSPSRAL